MPIIWDFSNLSRTHVFLAHCPDFVIVDEAHTASNKNKEGANQQQRYQLVKQIAEKKDRHLVLLTATPHSGISASFESLLGLIKPEFESYELYHLSESRRKELACHFVQRRRADVRTWLGNETPFSERESLECAYKLSKEYRALFEQVYNLARGLVKDENGNLSYAQRRGRYWSVLAIIRCVMSSPTAAIAWGDAKTYWAAFQRRLAKLAETETATSLTREYWAVPLLESLGYTPEYQAKAEIVEGQTFAISHRADGGVDKPPIHIIGSRLRLEERIGKPRLSAHALIQEYLNCTEHLWGIVTNGSQWRLLRDCSLMTRLTYVEFDLEQIHELLPPAAQGEFSRVFVKNENYAEFGLFYHLFHRTRLPEGMEDADKCLLEFYHQQTLQQGGRVRDRLRDGV